MIVLLESYQSGLLKPKYWLRNILAGLIVGVVALPLSMAFAIASGVKPEHGLYTAIVAGVVAAIFGGSRLQISGPTGAFVVILASITAKYGFSGLQLATLMAGFILIFMGYLRLGSVIKFIPDPVIVGFTTGIGLVIFIGEWRDFFGLSASFAMDAQFYQKLIALVKAFPHASMSTTVLACLSLVLVLITPKIIKRLPGPLVALVVMGLVQALWHFPVATLGSAFGGIPQQLPAFQIPHINLNDAIELIGPAFTIALLGAIESLLSATAVDGMANTTHNANQELIGQGMANVITPLFGGFAATGAIARTATNFRSGGNSPLAAIVHSLFLLLTILLLAPYAADIPLCTLAAILFVVAYNMSDIPHFMHILKCAPRYDVVVLLITFLLTVFTNLVLAVNVGVIFAMLFFIRRMHQLVSVEEQSQHEDLNKELASHHLKLPDNTMVYRIQGPFFFGAAEKIEHALAVVNADPGLIIFRLKDVPFIDMTGLDTFHEILDRFHQRGIKVYLCEANSRIEHKLKNAGLTREVENHAIYRTFVEVVQAIGA